MLAPLFRRWVEHLSSHGALWWPGVVLADQAAKGKEAEAARGWGTPNLWVDCVWSQAYAEPWGHASGPEAGQYSDHACNKIGEDHRLWTRCETWNRRTRRAKDTVRHTQLHRARGAQQPAIRAPDRSVERWLHTLCPFDWHATFWVPKCPRYSLENQKR